MGGTFFKPQYLLIVSLNPKWALFGSSNRYQSNRSLHASSPILKSTSLTLISRLSSSCGICVSPPTAFIHTQTGGKIDNRQETKHSASLPEPWLSVFLQSQTVNERRRETSRELLSWRLCFKIKMRWLHRLLTSHTTNQVLFFLY